MKSIMGCIAVWGISASCTLPRSSQTAFVVRGHLDSICLA